MSYFSFSSPVICSVIQGYITELKYSANKDASTICLSLLSFICCALVNNRSIEFSVDKNGHDNPDPNKKFIWDDCTTFRNCPS